MRLALALVLAACSHPAKPVRVDPSDPPLGSDAARFDPALVVPATVDAAPPSQDEKLAAIQKAMNELDEAAQGCWAMAATEQYMIQGDVTMAIDIAAGTKTWAGVVMDTTQSSRLTTCLTRLLRGYNWAPPLIGESIQLPFKFVAPNGQSVIDRTLVEWHDQQNTSVAVLLDKENSGNSAASMFEIAVAPRGSTGMRVAERSELWYFLGEVEVKSARKGEPQFHATAMPGTMMFVPKGTAREVIARRLDMHAVVVMVPGGREGSARAGALPTTMQETGTGVPVPLPAGTQYGPANIFLDPSVVKAAPMSASILELPGDARVEEHVHAGETELLYMLEGRATLTIAGQDITLEPTSVVQIPPNTKHALRTNAKLRALQIYTPPGPEQRFKKKTP